MSVRFWAKVAPPDINGCRLWTGAVFKSGYGAFKHGITWRAHRMAWVLAGNKLDSDKIIMHLCSNKLCCNPEHLQQSTQSNNLYHAAAHGKMTRHTGVNADKRFDDAIIQAIVVSTAISCREWARRLGCEHHIISRIRKEHGKIKATGT